MKKLLITSSFLILSSTVGATSVGGSIGGWNVVSQVANGIGQKLTATKNVMVNGASKVVTGTANLTPNPGNMARFMGKVGAAAVVTEAVHQILNGVDYVMDPENNTIRKKISDGTASNNDFKDNTTQLTGDALCFKVATDGGFSPRTDLKCTMYYSGTNLAGQNCFTASFYRTSTQTASWKSCFVNATYTEPEVKYEDIPIATVSAQIIDQAESDIRVGNPTSPAVALSRAVAQDMAAEAETDDVKARPISNQFEQTQTIDTNEDATGTIDTPEVVDPVTGEVVKPGESSSISMKWIKACDWFPQLCVFIDWAMTDPNVEEEEVPEKELEKQEIDEDLIKINSRSCPADVKFDVSGLPFGIQINKGYNMQEICNTVEPLKYVFQAVSLVICGFMLLRV